MMKKWKNLTNDTRYFIITGGRGCFCYNQLVDTKNGNVPISEIKIGDLVSCYNENKKCIEYKKVLNTFKYDNETIIRIKLKNGSEIKVTENHKFFHNGGWISVKDLLSLYYGNMEKDRAF